MKPIVLVLTGAVALATAGAPSGPGGAATAGPATGQHDDVAPAHRGGSGGVTSRNWAGYLALGHGSGVAFTSVRSTWVQPVVTCPAPDAWVVFWVGLDGWLDGTVEQGGSSARCTGGVPHYQTWWETYPGNPIQTVGTVRPGDTLTASVTYAAVSRRYTITVRDVSAGTGFTRTVACAAGQRCERSSAEVVAEDVGHFGAGSYFPLAAYAPVTFRGTVLRDQAGRTGAFASPAWRSDAITESSAGTTYATVGPLSQGGTRFTATWLHP